jgi:hypothetical protein
MGFNDYFLIVRDFVREAMEKGYYYGPGRGSSSGSILSYALYITHIDPIEEGLIFERQKEALVKPREFRGTLELALETILSEACMETCLNVQRLGLNLKRL